MTFRINWAPDGFKIDGDHYNPMLDIILTRLDAKGQPMGIVQLNNYSGKGGSVEVHVASYAPNWVSRDFIWMAVTYPFEYLEIRKLIAPVPTSNEPSIRFTRHFGFRLEHTITDVFPNGDGLHIYGMMRKECRWLGLKAPKGFNDERRKQIGTGGP